MNKILSAIWFLFITGEVFADNSKGSREQLPSEVFADIKQCDGYCARVYRRCISPPDRCGGCLAGYLAHDGLCQQPAVTFDDDNLDDLVERNSNDNDNSNIKNDNNNDNNKKSNIDNSQYIAKLQETEDKVQEKDKSNQGPEIESVVHYEGDTPQEKLEQVLLTATTPSPVIEDKRRDQQEGKGKGQKDGEEGDDESEIHPTPAMVYQEAVKHNQLASSLSDVYFILILTGCAAVAVFGLVAAGVCYYRLRSNAKAAAEAEYPAYGITGPSLEKVGPPGDRKLAQSAQMYHYQHQKQQMIAMEKATGELHKDEEGNSEEENEEGDYTVYECPGLAPTADMEVKNPLFSETPVTPGGRETGSVVPQK